MKKVYLLFLLILFCLSFSSCARSPQIDYEAEYAHLYKDYEKLYNLNENYIDIFSSIEDDISTIHCYLDHEPDISLNDAQESIEHIISVFSENNIY